MKKLAFVSIMGTAPWGGSEELWSHVALRLRQRGTNVAASVVGWPTLAPQIQELENAGCQMDYRPSPLTLANKVKRKLLGDKAFSWLDSAKPDFVVISQGGSFDGYAWMNACARRRIPYASIAQSANPAFNLEEKLGAAQTAYAGAKVAFFVSRGNFKLIEKQLSQPVPQGEVIRNPFNVSYDVQVLWPEASETFKLACVGRLDTYQKGQDLIVDVLSQDKWRQRPLSITLYGEGPSREYLTERIETLGLKNIVFGGFMKDVSAIWKAHHALILTSRYEGLPIVVVDAMMCNRFCIVTDVPGNAELMRDNISGFVAADTTSEAVDEALERAWEQRHRWQEIGQLAGQDVRGEFPRDPIEAFIEALTPHIPFAVGTANE